jgi:hypothetical protein
VEINEAIGLLKKTVKNAGTVDQNHIDLTLVPADELPRYQEALKTVQTAIKAGELKREEFNRRVHLDS